MPSRVKLLNAQVAGVTGTSFKNGQGRYPYTLYTRGGYSLGNGAAGAAGVNIEVSDDDVNYERGIGVVGGQNYTESTTTIQELVDIPDKTIIAINQYHKFIRGVTGNTMIGTATLVLEHTK